MVLLATGITQNVEDCLNHITGRTMLANSEYLVMLNQAPTDRERNWQSCFTFQTNSFPTSQMWAMEKAYSNAAAPSFPFMDNFPHNSLYDLMSTCPGQVQEILA